MTIPILKSPHEMLLELAGIPHLAGGGQPPKIVNPEDTEWGAYTHTPGYYHDVADSINKEGQGGGPNDALRHILTAADYTRRANKIPVVGKYIADPLVNVLGTGHEILNYLEGKFNKHPQTYEDLGQDLYNNKLGRQIGANATSFQDIVNQMPKVMDTRPYRMEEGKALLRNPDEAKKEFKPFGFFADGGAVHMQTGGQPPQQANAAMFAPHIAHNLKPVAKMTPAQIRAMMLIIKANQPPPKNPIELWGANPENKWGAKDRMMTKPWILDKDLLQDAVKAMRAGEYFGVPQYSPAQLVKMQLPEGDRSDFGANQYDTNNAKENKTYDMLREMGHSHEAATFAAALQSNTRLAKTKGVPFLENWNGLGTSELSGRTGAQHNQRANEWEYAVNHPKNEPFLNMVTEAYNYQPPTKPDLGANEYATPMGDYQNQRTPMFANCGTIKPFRDISKMLIQKYISGN